MRAGARQIPLVLIRFAAGIATAIPLWGDKARPLFYSTVAEVIALGAVGMALQGRLFQLSGEKGRRGGYAMATVLVPVGVGLAFAFAALARDDGGGPAHLSVTAGGLAMGVSR